MKRFIEGQDRGQLILLPECLDDYVGEENPVRVVETTGRALDSPGLMRAPLWTWVRGHAKRRGDRPRSTRRDDRISLRHFRCTFGALFAALRPPIIRLVRLR